MAHLHSLASNTLPITHGFMKNQIDLFGNIISMEEATVKPVVKPPEEKPKKQAESALQTITPYTICKESRDITWIINTQT
jgi:hypothetical protein